MHHTKFLNVLNTPRGVVVVVAAVVLGAEFLFMAILQTVLIPMLPFRLSDVAWGVIDAVTLAIVISPALYFLIFRRMQTDNAARQQLEANLQTTAYRYAVLVNAILDGIIVIDAQGRIQDANPAAVSLFGYAAEAMQGQNVKLLMPEPYAREHDGYLHNYLTTGKKKIIGIGREVTGRRQDGSTFPMDLEVSEMLIDGERLFVGVVRDISERKRADAAVRASEDQLSRAQQVAHVGSFDWNPVSGELTWSDEHFRLWGLVPQTVTPSVDQFRQAVHPDDVARVDEALLQALQGGQIYDCVHRLVWPDGSVHTVHGRGEVTFNDVGQAVRMIGTVLDVTEEKKVEQALIAARDQAEHASRAKSDFLSSMSHELRTPLNTIIGFTQVLEADLKLAPGSREKESFDLIQKAGWDLLKLVNQVLDLVKVEADGMDLSMEWIGLQPLLEECVDYMHVLAAARQVDVRLDEMSCAGLIVFADRDRLRQAVLNLLSNAVKYNAAQGQVEVSCALVDNNEVRIVVTDNGPGLTPEQQAHLFEPFNRLGREGMAEEGAGVGLTLTRRMLELMDGHIGFESAAGQGSRFWLELPSQRADAAQSKPNAPSRATLAAGADNRAVLYVDDNPDSVRLVARILGRLHGLQLLTAHTGELGLEVARTRRPDLIILDINLPGMDGYEVLRQFRADPRTAHIPVIALTADALAKDVKYGKAAGFDDYLIKPLNMARFVEVTESLLGLNPP